MEISWIKITTNIFDDEKILLIESLPEADSIIVIWFKLLTLAGKCNKDGLLMLNDSIPYTEEMLATLFRRNLNTVRLALETFEKFGMIVTLHNTITIPNWEKHQQTEKLNQIREQTRKRVQACRERQKLQLEETCSNSADVTQDVTLRNTDVTQQNKNKNKNKNLIYTSCENPEKTKHKFGSYENVLLTQKEYDNFVSVYGQEKTDSFIQNFSELKEMKGYKYKSDYLALKKWGIEAYETTSNGHKKNEREQLTDEEYRSFSDNPEEIPY